MSTKSAPRRVAVVGGDDPPTRDLTLGWAEDEPTRRALPLHVIHGFP
jgi:hypothetical protein